MNSLFFRMCLTVAVCVVGGTLLEVVHGSEMMRVHDGPSGVAWVVQVSDLHFSKFHPERSQSFRTFMGGLLAMIKPSLVLITGDLVDSKSKDRKSTRQDETEWIDYNNSMHTVVKQSGLPLQAFWDIHGNHDKYGVPYGNSPLDFFPTYSLSAHLNRNRSVHSLTLLGKNGWRHLFVGLDQAMSIGLRGPSNLFGHPDDKSLEDLDTVLSEWDNFTAGTVTKHVFGHFPTSFTAATEAGGRLEGILAKHSISAYVCGHLHAKFGKHLYKHHRVVLRSHEYSLQGPSAAEFWEWEMGDWRQSRLVRVMAIDQGRTSFTDFRLYGGTNFSDPENIQLPTVIIPTFPLDSRFMLTKSHGASRQESTIRALIFSPDPQFSVYVKILDTKASTVLTIYEQPMLRVPGYADGPLFQASWEPQKFSGASPTRYWLQITVNSSSNTILASDTRPFSVHNKDAGYRYTWMEFLVMGFRWESFSMLVLLATLLAILLGIIIIPKVISTWAQRVDIYSKFVPSVSDSFCISTIAKAPLWVLMEGAQNSSLWWSETALLVYLVLFPWFWGLPLAEGYPVGFMSMWGWTIAPSWTKPAHGNVGAPDNMNIVLPFLCTVFLPCLLISAALSAEQAAYEKLPRTVPQHHCDASEDSGNVVSVTRRACKAKPTVLGFQRLSGLEYAADNEMNTEAKGKVVIPGAKVATSKRPMRKLLLVGCLLVFYLHAKMCGFMVSSFGVLAVLASPGLAWSVPLLLIIATWTTSSTRRSPLNL